MKSKNGNPDVAARVRQMTLGKRLWVSRLAFQPTDFVILGALLLFNVLTLFYQPVVEGWSRLLWQNTGIAVLYIFFIYLNQRTSSCILKFLIRTASVQLLFAYLYIVVRPLQLILIKEWNDRIVLDLEHSLFGIQPLIWLEKITTPPLTEWMMFAYVIYIPLYPVLCAIIYFKWGERHMENYLFTLGITNVLCDIGFILFPVAGPLHRIGNLFSVPLEGYFFTFWGEYIRNNVHSIGGTIPSPHCAAATIMWVMAYRYHRPFFYLLSPVILSLYVSAVYGRYHYLTDVVIGILTALLAVAIAPVLIKSWNRFAAKQRTEET